MASASTCLRSCWRRTFWAHKVIKTLWHVWLFWETITASHVCRYSVNHNVHLVIALTAESDTSKGSTQAHILCEVGILGTALWMVYSETIPIPIVIEIGSYLTDKEQKITWQSFFLRHGLWYIRTCCFQLCVDVYRRKWERWKVARCRCSSSSRLSFLHNVSSHSKVS